jgi:DpnII restriction endonuclease
VGERAVARIVSICERFPLVVKRLAKRHADRKPLTVNDEYDVQDLLEALLATDFDNVHDEEFTPLVAGANSRIDFVAVGPNVAIEAKMTRAGLEDRKLGEELIVDLRRYESHPTAEHLVFFVYDPKLRVKNPVGLKADIEKTLTRFQSLTVVIAPKGM